MFENISGFYPTPPSIIEKMLKDLDFRMVHTFLEPSAGKGNIVDALKQNIMQHHSSYRYNSSDTYTPDVDCIEMDQNLCHILKGKGYRVVHDDFLTYETMKEYHAIIMNPPFSDGCKHLLKALRMQERNGGIVVCLLNAETLKNPHTKERQDLQQKLTEYDAKIEFIQDAFLDAERKTAVEIALVKVQLPEVKRESFILEGLREAKYAEEYHTNDNTQLVDGDFFKAIVNQFQLEVEAGIKLIKEYFAMQPLILSSFEKDEETGETVQKGGCMLSMKSGKNGLSVNEYIKSVRRKYWTALFRNPKFIGQLTNNLQRDFYNKLENLSDYDFSLYNIYLLKINRHSPYLSITLHKCYPYYLFGISTFPSSVYHSIALRKFSITIV